MNAYSSDLRVRLLKDCDGRMTPRLAALKYDVSESCVQRLKQRRRGDLKWSGDAVTEDVQHGQMIDGLQIC